ncbi:MAG: aminopeptidase P family protein [Pseudomonadota bacterium]
MTKIEHACVSTSKAIRPDFFAFHNGEKAKLPFSRAEYDRRLSGLRDIMSKKGIDVALITSMHGVAYYSGFLYCAFGRPYACVVTHDRSVTVSANIDAGQPWRRSADENLVYTDWRRDNYWRAILDLVGTRKTVGMEADHLTLSQHAKLEEFLEAKTVDIAPATMCQRTAKSEEEIALIREGARIADIGGAAVKDAIKVGTREIDVAMAGRDAMEAEISRSHPDSELRDTWVWFQSGINTDGAHNPVTTRKLVHGDILSLNTFPMISGYYTALERTLFIGEPDTASLKIWEANVGAHELGLSLIKQGTTCSAVCAEINSYFEERNLLQNRTFGYGHSFGVLSHYYGREAGLELREDIDTELTNGMVVSMEPMLTLPEGTSGAGGYREHDIVVLANDTQENITGFPYGAEHNIVAA